MQPSPLTPILEGLLKLQKEYNDAVMRLIATKPFLTPIDVRIAPFLKCQHVIQSSHVSMILFDWYVGELGWWNKHFQTLTREQAAIAAHEYDRYHRLAFIHLLHFAVDSSLRVIDRKVKQDNRATDKSEALCPRVLRNLGLEKWQEILDIIRLLRNTGHNNGRHTGKTVTKHLRGKPITFEKDREPEAFAWMYFIELAQEVKSLFVDIANSDRLPKSEIADPNASAIRDFHKQLFAGK